MIKIISANRLADGIVVYRTATAGWAPQIGAAALFSPQDAAAALAGARQDEARNIVVDATIVDAEAAEAGPRAATLRERIRAGGPTVAYGRFAARGR